LEPSSGPIAPGLSVVEAPKEFKWTTIRERFCEEYLVDFDGANAYRRAANYTTNENGDGAKQRAYELMEHPEIRHRIAELVKGINDQTRLRVEEVEQEIKALALSDVGEMFDLDADDLRLLPMREWPKLARRCVSSIKARKYPVGETKGLGFITADDMEYLEKLVEQLNSPTFRAIFKTLREIRWDQYQIIEIKLWDKNAALEKAGKILKMFTEILEHRGIITFAEVTRKVSPDEWVAEFREGNPLRPQFQPQPGTQQRLLESGSR
jgi:hypothetical protein